jgi:LuxR family maltose regulon positive regulatory protein
MATKLYVPQLRRGLVPRPRLLALLERGIQTRLTLVSAPAGFGKTTLLVESLEKLSDEDHRLAWLSLDPSDHDPVSFWTSVVSALGTALPHLGSELLELIDATPLPTELVLTTLVNDLAAAPTEVWLVLDDYHVVDSSEVDQGLAFLLDHLPPQVHVVVSTRADPNLPLPRWRVRGQLVEIRAADLRFTPAETAAYLADASDRHLTAADVQVLGERTEGWIAALQLAALSIRGRDDVSSFIAGFAGNDRYIVDYLVEEVLAHQPDPIRTFLLQSAVLDRLTGPLCDAVTGLSGGSQTLEALDRANLLVIALDDRREWYRYHHLFADVLRARLLAEQPDLVPLLHQRASQWYERHDLTEEAIAHALAARDFDRASHLMELAVPMVRRHRQEALMHGWLKALPTETVRRSPVLSLFYGAMLMASGDLGGVDSWLDNAERALTGKPEGAALPWAETSDLLTLPSTVAMYRAALAQARGDVTGTDEHARRALDLAGPDDHLARGGAAGFLGFAAWAQGDVSRALETFTQAVASLHAAGNLVDALSGTVVLGDLWLAAGRPSQARRLCTQALVSAEAQGVRVARATAELHVAISELDVEVGDLESARLHLDAAAALTNQAPMTESRYRWFVAKALLSRADGDPEEAVRLLDQAQQAYRPGFFPDVRPIPALRARTWIIEGELTRAAAWAAERGVSVSDEARYLSEFDDLTLVRLLLAQDRTHPESDALDGAGDLLDRLCAAAEAAERAGSVLEIQLLQALVQDAQGRRSQAVETLVEALRRAPEPDGYLRRFVDEGEPLMGLLRAAEQAGVAGDWLRRVLAHDAPDAAGAPSSARPLPMTVMESLTERELEVLRLLDSELTGPQIARKLFLSHNTVRTHTKHIFTKLDVTTRRAAVLRARERGLL